jgi:lauroyl/myristoyl acyltransferase
MSIDLQHILDSSFSLRLVSSLAKRLPRNVGYRIADGIAAQIARRRDARVVRALRLNQWVVGGETLEEGALDERVRETLRHAARSVFDLYHDSDDFEATGQRIVLDPSFAPLRQRPEYDRRGLVVAGLHLSSFDLILQWLVRDGLKPLVLTIPDPRGGRQVEYEIRKKTGMNLLPASVGAFRQALRHLQRGGMVLTGIDRPIEQPGICPHFFGRPAALPTHHIFLASRARVPLIVTAVYFQEDEKYHVLASEPIELEEDLEPGIAIQRNAETVLHVAQQFIQQAPQQWVVPLPVWPQLMDLVPQ